MIEWILHNKGTVLLIAMLIVLGIAFLVALLGVNDDPFDY